MTDSTHLPTSWTYLEPREENQLVQTPLLICFGGLAILVFGAICCGIARMCRKEEFVEMEEGPMMGPGYSVAISNSLFKETSDGMQALPCLNCRLIEMGEMACYQERCPQCGQIPPGRKRDSVKRSRWSMKSIQHKQRYSDSKV